MVVAVLLTVIIALPWVAVRSLSQAAREAKQVQLALELPPDASLERGEEIAELLEASVADTEGIDRVETVIREGTAQMTVYLLDKEGKVAGKNLRGDELLKEVGKLLGDKRPS